MNKCYTKAHIDFIMAGHKKGLSYEEIAESFGKKFGIEKTPKSMSETFYRYKHQYELDGLKTKPEVKAEVMTDMILDAFLEEIESRNYIPTQAEFGRSSGFKPAQIAAYFQTYQGLEDAAREGFPEVFEDIYDETMFDGKHHRRIQKRIDKAKRFFITTASTGCAVNTKALASAQNFCRKNKAELLILVCSDPAHTRQSKYSFVLHPDVPAECVVSQDVQINNSLHLSTIKMGAKHINPLNGLERLAQKRGSFLFASPKQDLQPLTDKNKKAVPKIVATTGAITVADYSSDLYMSDRTAKIAEGDHVPGGMIVEVKNKDIFFLRNARFAADGSFRDLDTQYLPNGKTKKVTAELVGFGDYHVLSTDPLARKGGFDLVNKVKPDYLTVEDFLDGITINPHTKSSILAESVKFQRTGLSLADELKACSNELNELEKLKVQKQIVLKYGNHEDFLYRWLNSAGYADDKINHYEGLCLAKVAMEGDMPFEHAMRVRYPVSKQGRFRFLSINESFRINGIENGAHGHLGANGKRNPTLVGVRNAYGACNVGHNHTGAIYKDVFRVGTKTRMQLDYNDGPSSWTHSDVIQHRDGMRQLITYIDGEFTLKR